LLILVFIMCSQFPLVFRKKLLHPLSRRKLFKINYFSMFLEYVVYLLYPALLIALFQLIPFPDLTIRQFTFEYQPSYLIFHTSMVSLITMPIIQYRRRKIGLSLPSFIFSICIITTIVLLVLRTVSYVQMSMAYFVCSYSILIALSQLLLITYYKKLSLKGDMDLEVL